MEEMTWPEVKAAADAGLPVVLPVGSTEQHGPHLPLNTDCVLPVGIALRASSEVPLVVAPAIRFGARSRPLTGGGEGFPGTVSLSVTTLVATLGDVLDGLARSGFTRICVLNFHYENAGVLWEATDIAARRHPDVRFVVLESALPELSSEETEEIFHGDFQGWDVEHASMAETSMMLVFEPRLVRRDLIADDQAARRPAWEVIPPRADTIPESGVFWRPSTSTEEAGERLVELCVRQLVDAIRTELT
jgi:creatinine amidohydrolase